MIMTALCNGTCHDLTTFSLDGIEPWVIAKSLAHLNRFCGHAGTYSVAQHSVYVASKLPDELKLSGLLHDAHECLIGDIPQPVKQLLDSEWLDRIDAALMYSIDKRFGTITRHKLVKEADLRALMTEAKCFGLSLCPTIAAPYEDTIDPWPPGKAAEMWLQMFDKYYKGVR